MLSKRKIINELRYKIYCPENATTDNGKTKKHQKRPVLCFLHGSEEHHGNLRIKKALRRHGPLKNDPASREALDDRFIVIFPQLPAPGGDVWQDYAEDVEEIVKSVWLDYGGDPQRTYLTGFSYGGNGVFRLAVLQPALWAAVWPVDPVMRPPKGIHIPVLVTLGEYARRHQGDLQNLDYREINSGRIRGDMIYIDYKKDHVHTATAAYRDKRIYDWLLKKKNPNPSL